MPNRPLQHNLRIPSYFQNLAVDPNSITELIESSEAVRLCDQRLDVSWLNLQAFIEVLKSVVVSMQFCEDLCPKNESIEVLGKVLERICKLNNKLCTTKSASSYEFLFLWEIAKKR